MDNDKPLKDNEDLAYYVNEILEYCKNDLKYDIEEAMKQSDKKDLDLIIEDLRKQLNSVERELHAEPEKEESEEKHEGEQKDDGPMIVLMSDCYWARNRSFLEAKERLHGEEPRIAFVTTDQTASIDGTGGFRYDPSKPYFSIPLCRRVSGPNKGKPGTVEYHEPC